MDNPQNKIQSLDKFKKPLIAVGLFIAVLLSGSYYASYKESQQLTNEFKNALSGEKGSGQYSEVLNKMFGYYKNQSELQFPYLHQLDSLNILDIQSFISKESIGQISEILKDALIEIDSYDEKMNGVILGARSIIQNSNFSQSEKDQMLSGFDKSFQDQKSKQLSSTRIVAMRNLYEKILSLYEFMLANFDDYQIQNDQISFYSDSNIARYNQIIVDVQKLATEFQKANSEFTTYKNESFKSGGIDIKSTDVQNYFNQ